VKINKTVLLEAKYGWKGILAEPNFVWHQSLVENRSAIIDKRCVHSMTGQELEFLNTENPEYSGLVDAN